MKRDMKWNNREKGGEDMAAETLVLNIGGMSCNHCKMEMEKVLRTLDGVDDVQINLETGQATVSFDSGKLQAEDLRALLGEAGYEIH